MYKKITSIAVIALAGLMTIATPLFAQEVYLVGADYYGRSNYILCNLDGTFSNQQYMGQVPQPYYSYGNGIGDFDNDGDFDYIIGTGYSTTYAHHVYLYEKLGSGNTFAAPVSVDTWTEGGYPMDMPVADYNNDGNMDFVLSHYDSPNCELYLGNGNLTFTRSILYSSAPTYSIGADAGDFNNDGNADFVVCHYSNSNPDPGEDIASDTSGHNPYYLYINLGNGDGTFTTSTLLASSNSWGVTAGDFDNDGNQDIITDGYWSYTDFFFYKGNGDGTFQSGVVAPGLTNPYLYPTPVDNFDLNDDGNMDVVIGYGYSVRYYSGNGDGTFTYVTEIMDGTGYDRYCLSAPPGVMPGSPVADADPDSQTISVGGTADFDGSNSFDTDGGTIISYDWNFGDGFTGTGMITSHTYTTEGIFNVRLTVTDNDNKTGRDLVRVKVLGNPPVADVGGPYAGTQYVPLTFDGSGSTDDYGIIGYEWDFGDGSTGSGVTPMHTYFTSGTFTVTLTVTDTVGQSNTSTTTADISSGPPRYHLYVGTTNPGKVCAYFDDSIWVDISPSLGFSVTSLIMYEDEMYAGVITSSNTYSSQGLVLRYDGYDDSVGEHVWTQVGLLDNRVCVLVEFNGDLYAGTGLGSARLYRYDPGTESWTLVIDYSPWEGVRSAHVWGDWLYIGDWLYDKFARWDGTTFEDLGDYGGSCIYNLEAYGEYLYGSAYVGAIYRLTYSPSSVTRIWYIPDSRFAWALDEFQDRLYIGVDWTGSGAQQGQLWRYNRHDDTREIAWFVPVSNTYEGIISLTSDGDFILYIGVGGQVLGYPTDLTGAGTGQVWTYDGFNYTKISTDGSLGTGAQTLLYSPPVIGAICGDVTLDNGNPVANVTVKVIDSDNNQVGDPIVTGSDGSFYFDSLLVGTYSVMIVTPLGYSVSPDETQTGIEVTGYPCTEVDFVLTPTITSNDCRTIGYWKHQFDVYLSGRGHAEESSTDLEDYLDLVHLHFDVLGVYIDLENFDFEDAKDALTVRGGRLMEDRAKQQLFGLLLNFASGKIGNETVVSEDGRVAAEAVTLVATLINDGDPANDELAKTICDLITNGQIVEAGIIPESPIRYRGIEHVGIPMEYTLNQNYPNPFNPATEISYTLPRDGHVKLEIYNLLGQKVATLVDEYQQTGRKNVNWEPKDLASGIYFYKLSSGDFTVTKKMVLTK